MKLLIIGASGQGKVAADVAEKTGYDEIEFYDDNEALSSCGKWRVAGKTNMAKDRLGDVFIAVGNARVREKLTAAFAGRRFATLIHPDAVVAQDVAVGEGTVVMAGAVINPGAKIGRGVIINTCSSVDHDCTVGDFAHISVGAHLAGTVSIGQRTWIAIGAAVSNNISICPDCMIGAGAVVIHDIDIAGTYVGVPAHRIKGKAEES